MMTKSKVSGIALLLCLFFMFLFSSIAIYISAKTKQEIELVQSFEEKLKAKLRAHSLQSQIVYNLAAKDTETLALLNQGWQQLDTEVRYQINLAEGMFNFSGIELTEIREAFYKLGLNSIQINTFLSSLTDWQDSDNNSTLYGKEQSDDYQVRNRALPFLSEVRKINGMEESLFAFIERNFLLYRPTEFSPSYAIPEIAPLIKADNRALSYYSPFYVVDIEIKTELQTYSVRYGINLWYSAENGKIIFEYLRQ